MALNPSSPDRFLCITPHMAIERNWLIPGFEMGKVFRAQETILQASGKGINAARAVRLLGAEPYCMGFLAGHTGRWVAEMIIAEGLSAEWTWINGETRTVAAIIDPRAGRDAAQISEDGPDTSKEDWERLAEQVLHAASRAKAAAFSGSFPPGTPYDRFARLVRDLQAAGCPVWIDSSGPQLRAAVEAGAAGVKVNGRELGSLLNREIDSVEAALRGAQELRDMGAGTVAVTLGADGAVLAGKEGAWIAHPPAIPRISSIGSGDCFLAGLLVYLQKGSPMTEALRWATAAGAANAMSFGAGKFSLEELQTAYTGAKVEPAGGRGK